MHAMYLVLRHVPRVGFVFDVEEALPEYDALVVESTTHNGSQDARRRAIQALWCSFGTRMLEQAKPRPLNGVTLGTRMGLYQTFAGLDFIAPALSRHKRPQ